MPNRRELESLIDVSRSNPAIPAGNPFELDGPPPYWTSTTYAGYEGQGAWAVNIDTGETMVLDKKLGRFVWPVRDAIED
jgi:hypothetical protein